MNTGITITTILSLVLALVAAGGATNPQANAGNSLASPRGHNLNHNETLARDRALTSKPGTACPPFMCNHNETMARDTTLTRGVGAGGCAPWVCGENHNETLVRDTQLKTSAGAGCSPWICGSNHNETLVRDKASAKVGGYCPPWMCNHNETLMRDTALTA